MAGLVTISHGSPTSKYRAIKGRYDGIGSGTTVKAPDTLTGWFTGASYGNGPWLVFEYGTLTKNKWLNFKQYSANYGTNISSSYGLYSKSAGIMVVWSNGRTSPYEYVLNVNSNDEITGVNRSFSVPNIPAFANGVNTMYVYIGNNFIRVGPSTTSFGEFTGIPNVDDWKFAMLGDSSDVNDYTTDSNVGRILLDSIPNNLLNFVTHPNTPSSMTKPNTAKVGQTINVSWTSVPLPTQPEGITLTSNTVYYEVDFFDGTKWVPVTGKTSSTNVNYTIPTMVDRNDAKFRVRAFVEAYGQRHYGGYRESATMTVYNNNKPTIPQAFSAPVGSDRLRVGFSYNIAWGPASDLDNDPLTYQLDFFNGSTWTTVADGIQGTNRQFVVPTGPDTLQAQFRVRAYDGREYSEYRYSDRFEVFTNTPPNTPRPFTLPKSDEMRIIDLQTPYRVEWGEADVEEHETARYEVSFRASHLDNWQVIRDINHPDATKTYMDHILPNVQDSETAQYRVRAYDGYEFGGYTESNYFSITGNKVTNTSGFNEEVFPRMAIGQEMRLSWQPAKTARNTDVYYDIEVFNGFEWLIIAHNVPTNSLVFRIPEMEDTPYAKIRIRSKTPFQFGGYVESDWIETPNFTVVNFFVFDDISIPFLNDVQKKENVDYLRQKVNDMRIMNDLPPMVFTDEVIIRYETPIKNVHFDELEQGILECFDKNPRAKFNSARTEQELRKVKEYRDQAELIQDLPQRLDFISKALMNQ